MEFLLAAHRNCQSCSRSQTRHAAELLWSWWQLIIAIIWGAWSSRSVQFFQLKLDVSILVLPPGRISSHLENVVNPEEIMVYWHIQRYDSKIHIFSFS